MKPFLNKDLPSFLYVMSILLFGCFLAVIIDEKIEGDLTTRKEVGMYLGMISMFLTGVSMYKTISKRNKTLNE